MLRAPDVFFLPAGAGARGQRLCLHHLPQGSTARGAVVYVHPFADEMNKSRRMAALQSRMLARAGHAVLQIDLMGCGDSSGDFGEAAWPDWVEDVIMAVHWMRQRHSGPLWLWGLRAGCLLAVDAARAIGARCNFLFWQPATSGKILLQQFLRLRITGELLDRKGGGTIQELRSQLAAGRSVEIAGYRLAPALAQGLEKAALEAPAATGKVVWLEMSTREEATLSPTSTAFVQRWQSVGHHTTTQVVSGPPFWQTSEIEEVPALVEATIAALAGSEDA
jgi:exosortase A-associated hydrolase 2